MVEVEVDEEVEVEVEVEVELEVEVEEEEEEEEGNLHSDVFCGFQRVARPRGKKCVLVWTRDRRWGDEEDEEKVEEGRGR